jgi:hypothetical protein
VTKRRKGGEQQTRAKVKGPFGVNLNVESSSAITPGIRADDVTSREGGFNAKDETGRGIQIGKAVTKTDIKLTNKLPPNDPDPKG